VSGFAAVCNASRSCCVVVGGFRFTVTTKPAYTSLSEFGGCSGQSVCEVYLDFTTCYYSSSANCETALASELTSLGDDDDDALNTFLDNIDCPTASSVNDLEISPNPIKFTKTVGTK
jgi:hypothetical protein